MFSDLLKATQLVVSVILTTIVAVMLVYSYHHVSNACSLPGSV